MRPRAFGSSLVRAVAAAVIAASSLVAAELRPSWECLPDDTAAMVRLPQPAAFLEALRTRTKFGAVALSEARIQGLWNAVLAHGGDEDITELGERMAKYGLERDDLAAALDGDVGAGVVVRPRGDGLPTVVMHLAWLEPGEERAARLVAAMKQLVEERNTAGEVDAPRRIDLEMGGHEVLWMIEPVMRVDLPDLDLDPEKFEAEKFKEELQRRMATARTGGSGATFVKTGQIHTLMARLGGRLVVGHTMPANGVEVKEGEDRDFDAESGTDEVRAVFERFIAAHEGDAESPLASVLGSPALAASLPGGVVLADVVVDPRVLVRAASDATTKTLLEAVGAADMGPFAWRQSLDGARFHSVMALALPAPRTNLMRILDQECDAAEVPSFVTREAIDFTQISLDLGKAYETIREFVVGQGGPETANMFMAVEMQAQGWLGVDLPGVLSSLGSRHWIVTYPPQVAEALAAARRARADGAPAPAREVADRLAIVWQIDDEGPLAKILQRLAGAVGGELQEEQGFRGIRIPDGAAIYMGQGHLVVAIGKDSLEKTLTAIRHPPAGDASLGESDVVRRAAELVPLRPARMFGISDSSVAGGTLGMLRDMAAGLEPDDVEEPYRELLAAAQKLLPSQAEMEGMFGVGATRFEVDDAGATLTSVWEMPAP
jgi:hypothetical protein